MRTGGGPWLDAGRFGVSGVDPLRPALGLLEVTSIARGVVVADALVKRAEVRLLLVRAVSPGKHLSLFTGGVEEVGEAMGAGRAAAGAALCDELLLPQVHEEVRLALSGERAPYAGGALGIFETFSAAAALRAADSACKAAEVRLFELRLCDGLGGKGFFLLTGELDMVEAALLSGERATVPGLFLGRELIPRPHEDLIASLSSGG